MSIMHRIFNRDIRKKKKADAKEAKILQEKRSKVEYILRNSRFVVQLEACIIDGFVTTHVNIVSRDPLIIDIHLRKLTVRVEYKRREVKGPNSIVSKTFKYYTNISAINPSDPTLTSYLIVSTDVSEILGSLSNRYHVNNIKWVLKDPRWYDVILKVYDVSNEIIDTHSLSKQKSKLESVTKKEHELLNLFYQ